MTFKFLRKVMVAAALLLVLFTTAEQASAHLIISPQRFVFENRVRSNTILLINGDTKPHTYRLSWRMMKMDENGVYHDEPMDEKDPFSVPNMVRYSPREVTIEAGGKQVVRMSLRAPANLPKGEYRAHLMFAEQPDAAPPKPASGKEGQSLNIVMQMGITVPVIVRSGDIKTGDVTMGTPKIADVAGSKAPVMKLDLGHVAGQGSVYGKIVVTAPDSTQIGLLNNIAIYPEMSQRFIDVPLTKSLPAGTQVTVAYEGDGEYKGKTFVTKQVTLTQ